MPTQKKPWRQWQTTLNSMITLKDKQRALFEANNKNLAKMQHFAFIKKVINQCQLNINSRHQVTFANKMNISVIIGKLQIQGIEQLDSSHVVSWVQLSPEAAQANDRSMNWLLFLMAPPKSRQLESLNVRKILGWHTGCLFCCLFCF